MKKSGQGAELTVPTFELPFFPLHQHGFTNSCTHCRFPCRARGSKLISSQADKIVLRDKHVWIFRLDVSANEETWFGLTARNFGFYSLPDCHNKTFATMELALIKYAGRTKSSSLIPRGSEPSSAPCLRTSKRSSLCGTQPHAIWVTNDTCRRIINVRQSGGNGVLTFAKGRCVFGESVRHEIQVIVHLSQVVLLRKRERCPTLRIGKRRHANGCSLVSPLQKEGPCSLSRSLSPLSITPRQTRQTS